MRLSMRLTLAMTTLAMSAVAAVSTLSYYTIERVVVPAGLDNVASEARARLGALITFSKTALRFETLSSRSLPAIDALARASLNGGTDPTDGTSAKFWRRHIEELYARQLVVKPSIISFRLIGEAAGGRDIVRIDRSGPGGAIRVVPASELLPAADDLRSRTATLQDGDFFLSIDRSNGRDDAPAIPVATTATPIHAANGRRFGLIVIEFDLRPTFERIHDGMNADAALYIVAANGDYLMHRSTSASEDAAGRGRWQDDFPDLATQVLAQGGAAAKVIDLHGERVAAGIALGELDGGPRVGVIETSSFDRLMAPAVALHASGLIVALLSAVGAVLLAILLARSLARPVVQITAAVDGFARTGQLAMPSGLPGEIKILAEAFERMVAEIGRATAALRSKSEVLDKTIASMADAVLLIDARGRRVFANPTCSALFGDRTDVGSSDWKQAFQRLRPDGVSPLPDDETPLARARRGESFDNVELAFRRNGEPLIQLVASGRPIESADGRFEGAVVVYRNLTAFKETERQLRQAQKMEAIGKLTGGVAHDFNNILTVITGGIEILSEGVADRPDLKDVALMIDQAVSRGSALTNQLLSFARKQPLQPRSVDVNALMLETAKLLRSTLGEHIQIEVSAAPGVCPAMADPSQLGSALINLAINARDAMPNGGKLILETGRVELDQAYADQHSEVCAGCYVLLAVSDAGTGIPAAIRDRVFEPFFTTKDVGEGTGLGLSMVYGFAKQSGGHVALYSEEGVGTTIRLYLPCGDAVSLPASDDVAALPVARGHESLLVVEDDPLLRRHVMAHLTALGYCAYAAATATEALELAAQGRTFDLLFTDVILSSGMNGRQLAEQLRKRWPALRVLFTSGYTERAVKLHGQLEPGSHLLEKPYRRAELARMLRLVLDGPTAAETN
jgi:signal transduction histidine kinase/CheY-like chemotaxis protein